MTRILTALASFLCLALSAAGLAACSPLGLFDAIGPRDAGARQAAKNQPFGQHPRQHLDVYVPEDLSEPAPVVVFFYGGSWSSGAKEDYAFVGHALAAQGFVTIVPDYRLATEAPSPAFLEDGAAAVAWAQHNAARFGGDPRRVALAGHSAGAYNALMLGLDPRYLRAAGADPRVVKAVAGLSGPYDFLPLDNDTTRRVFGQAPDLKGTQPVAFVGPMSPPAFLATGDGDTVVRPRNTQSLAERLRAANVPVQERVYAGLDHTDTLLALSVTFRSKAPELAEMAAFLRGQTASRARGRVGFR